MDASTALTRRRFGAAAINMLSQFGAFLGPYGWGVAKNATGSFQAALIALSFVALAMAGLLLILRREPHLPRFPRLQRNSANC